MSGPGRCVCWSAAARPRDRHTRASLGVVDLEARPGPAAADQHRGLAMPPPTGTAARFSGPSGTLHTSGACCAADDSPRLEARPGPAAADQHCGLALPPPTGTAAWPSGPSGALHTSGACCAEDDSPRPRPALALPPPTSTAAWPRHRPRVPWQVPRPLWHRGQARRSLRRSPVVCVFWIGSSVVDRNGASG